MSFGALVQKAWRKNLLLAAHFELTYACNLDCFFCYNDRGRQGTLLSVDEWKSLIDDLARMQVLSLVLSGGEPTVHPGFFAIGAHARRQGFVVRVKSNGHTLRGELLERMLAEVDPFVVEVSLHGATAATHDRQTRVPGSFTRLIENLRAARGRLRLQLNAPLTAWNEDEVEDMLALARALELPLRVDPEVTPKDNGSLEPLTIAPSAQGLARFMKATLVAGGQGGEAPPRAETPCAVEGEKHCGAGSASILVDPWGDVLPCVQWRRVMGNVRARPIAQIWSSGVFDDVRRSLVDVKSALAGEADHCPGIAQALTGSLTGVSAQAARRRSVRGSLPILGQR